ncbi:MAG: PhoH family protein [Victivallales bacterium]|jgi:phosphate starvation-inducible PhoH-like protein
MAEEEIFYFDGPEALASVFIGNTSKNFKLIEKELDVRIASRDLWVKIISADSSALSRTSSFIRELISLHNEEGKTLMQFDFEQLLSAYRHHREKEIHSLFSSKIKVGRKKPEIVPRTLAQLKYLQAIREKDIVFGVGPAGTGKTYLAMAMAVSEFLAGKYSRIILTRPAKEAGENLGFLPGNLEEKILPYLRPLYDALYEMLEFEEVNALMEKNIIEVAPLAFMRGRTLNHAFVILDEAQNTSRDQMLMFLTRLGFDSCCVITGDPSQTDLERNQQSGLVHANRVLKDIPDISFCHFSSRDVVRHALIEKIINAYSEDRMSSKRKPSKA